MCCNMDIVLVYRQERNTTSAKNQGASVYSGFEDWIQLECISPNSALVRSISQLTRLLHPWDSPGKNTGVGCHALLQGIFSIQGLNYRLLWLLHYNRILYCYAMGKVQCCSTKDVSWLGNCCWFSDDSTWGSQEGATCDTTKSEKS